MLSLPLLPFNPHLQPGAEFLVLFRASVLARLPPAAAATALVRSSLVMHERCRSVRELCVPAGRGGLQTRSLQRIRVRPRPRPTWAFPSLAVPLRSRFTPVPSSRLSVSLAIRLCPGLTLLPTASLESQVLFSALLFPSHGHRLSPGPPPNGRRVTRGLMAEVKPTQMLRFPNPSPSSRRHGCMKNEAKSALLRLKAAIWGVDQTVETPDGPRGCSCAPTLPGDPCLFMC